LYVEIGGRMRATAVRIIAPAIFNERNARSPQGIKSLKAAYLIPPLGTISFHTLRSKNSHPTDSSALVFVSATRTHRLGSSNLFKVKLNRCTAMFDAADQIPLGARQLVAAKTIFRWTSYFSAASHRNTCTVCRKIQQEKFPVVGG